MARHNRTKRTKRREGGRLNPLRRVKSAQHGGGAVINSQGMYSVDIVRAGAGIFYKKDALEISAAGFRGANHPDYNVTSHAILTSLLGPNNGIIYVVKVTDQSLGMQMGVEVYDIPVSLTILNSDRTSTETLVSCEVGQPLTSCKKAALQKYFDDGFTSIQLKFHRPSSINVLRDAQSLRDRVAGPGCTPLSDGGKSAGTAETGATMYSAVPEDRDGDGLYSQRADDHKIRYHD